MISNTVQYKAREIKMNKNTKSVLSVLILIVLSTQFLIYHTNVKGDAVLDETYNIPAESWYFILESENITASTIYTFEWASDAIIQGTPVVQSDYELMQTMSLLERSAYFEGLSYKEGIADTGKVTANENGEVFFVFFNFQSSSVALDMALSANTGALSPAMIGLIAALATIIFLSIVVYITVKIRQKMIKEAEEEEELTPQQRYMKGM